MDPNEALKQLREELHELVIDDPSGHNQRLVELFDGLDSWLSKGSFLPAAWARPCGHSGMVRIEGHQLTELRQALSPNRTDPVYLLRIDQRGTHVAYKVNEQGWSPPVGDEQKPY